MDLTGARVLVVDDNFRNREIALEYLRLRSVPCEAVDSAEAALDCLRQAVRQGRPYNLSILDHNMPGGMDGGELALAIKNEPEIKDIALILLSSFMPLDELQPDVRACFTAGLNKPIKVSLFFETLLEAWNTRLNGAPKRVAVQSAPPPTFQPLDFKARVLLVEDSRMNRQVAIEILKRFGCLVDVAENGLEAVKSFEANNYDIVFMDIHMPGMDDYIPKPIRSAMVRDVLLKMLAPSEQKRGGSGDVPDEPGRQAEMILNPIYLLDIADHDPDIIDALIKEFLRDAPIYLDDLKSTVTGEDQDIIYKTSHRLQGLTANAGGERVRAMLLDIEGKIRQGGYIPGVIDTVPLEAELKRLCEALQQTDWRSLCNADDY